MIKEELPIFHGPNSTLMTWRRSNPKKTAVVFIIVIAIVFIWIHGPFHRLNIMSDSIPMSLRATSTVNNEAK